MNLSLFATAPVNFSQQLADELTALGATDVKQKRAGAEFTGSLETAYRACLWSRIANRILLKLGSFPVESTDALYAAIQSINWSEHLAADGSLAIDLNCSRSAITHSHYATLVVKDAIVDQLRDSSGERPQIERAEPDLRVNVHIDRNRAEVSIDLSGDSLHKRGYRLDPVAAPLKENLAAALLIRAGWPEIAAAGGALVDPMCGSGTLPIEAALIAADSAPGLDRLYWGFNGWQQHDAELWQKLRDEAEERREIGLQTMPPLIGYDIDKSAVRAALANAMRAGLHGYLHIERRAISDARPPSQPKGVTGLVTINPPYGERLGTSPEILKLYREIGQTLQQHFNGWRAIILANDPELGFRIGIRSRKPFPFYNGALECSLLDCTIESARYFTPKIKVAAADQSSSDRLSAIMNRARTALANDSTGAEMLNNRLRKNRKHLARWARREGISCYRLYDADLPEYALAIDLYHDTDQQLWIHAQEYRAPRTIDTDKAATRLVEAITSISSVLEVPLSRIFLKVRQKQRGQAQYARHGSASQFHQVDEFGCSLLVNFEDYLDTGLFLDHRLTRRMIGEAAAGKHFLNLFGYTASATVHAARGGARTTTTVDLSKSYIDWATKNLALNKIEGNNHRLIQADCIEWIDKAIKAPISRRYGLIFLDPPTFSNSKSMRDHFDIQRDHVELIGKVARLLEPDGLLIFSTNFRPFKLDQPALKGLKIEEISRQTIPQDFARKGVIHHCWKISR